MGRTKSGTGHENTVDHGPAPGHRRDEEADGTANVKERGQDPSPGDRARGETSDKERPAPIDADTAHERAK